MFLILSFLFSCKPKTTVEIIIQPEELNVEPGDTAMFKIILTPDALNGGKLSDLEILDIDSTIIEATTLSGNVSDSFKFYYAVPPETEIGTSKTFIVCAYSNTKQRSFNNAILNVMLTALEIKTYTDVQSVFSATSLEDTMLIELDSSGIILSDASSNNADLAFVWDPTYGYSIVSPNSEWIADIFDQAGLVYNFSDKKATKLQLADSSWAYYNQYTIDKIVVENNVLQGGLGFGVQNLKENDVLCFETLDGRKGVMKINFLTKDQTFLISDIKYQM